MIPSTSPLPKAERGTTFAWTDADTTALVYTESLPLARRWTRLGYAPVKTVTLSGTPCGWHFRMPVGKITVRTPRKRAVRRPTPPRTTP